MSSAIKNNMSDELPQELQDDFGKAKIAVALGSVALVGGVVAGVATGVIPADNVVAQALVPVFTLLVGLAVGFFFKNKQ